MREETEARFRRLLEQHDRELLRPGSRRERAALDAQEWDRRFRETVESTVMPVFRRARALMHDHGLAAEIVMTPRRTGADGVTTPSSVSFEFRVLTDPETHGFPITTPSLTLTGEAGQEMVTVQENSVLPFLGGHVGIVDQCPLDRLTGELVERHLLAIARKVLRGTGAQ